MRRRLFTFAAALSLVLFAGTVAMWAASWIDGITVADGKLLAFHIGDPEGRFVRLERDWGHYSTAGIWRVLRRQAPVWHQWAGFGSGGANFTQHVQMPAVPVYQMGQMQTHSEYVSVTATLVAIPLWAVFLVFAILPAVWLRGRLRQDYRVRRTRCAACGYDLRASTDRCPECGRSVPRRQEVSA